MPNIEGNGPLIALGCMFVVMPIAGLLFFMFILVYKLLYKMFKKGLWLEIAFYL